MKHSLNELRERYAETLPNKIERMESARDNALTGETGEQAFVELETMAHSLAGSGAAFGYEEMGRRAGELLTLLRDEGSRQKDGWDRTMSELVVAIRHASRNPGPMVYTPAPERRTDENRNRLLFLVDDDKEFALDLAEQLGHFEYDTRVFNHPDGIEKAVGIDPPAAVIMDIMFGQKDSSGLAAGADLKEKHSKSIPLLFISARADLETRLEAVHAGGDAYFSKPLNIPALIEKLDELTIQSKKADHKIVILEDDELLGQRYELLLREAGMRSELLTDPADLFPALEREDADLILMDYQLSDHLGTEIMQVLKQHEHWSGIPVILISSTVDEDRQVEALLTGGEIFLKKPISPEVLLNAVRYRAGKARSTRDRLRTDGLSGLLNHNAARAELSRMRIGAAQTGRKLSVALVDIDEFKLINDTYGHPTGDRVIQCIGRLFQEKLSSEDVAARYGGEEFLLLLPGRRSEEALHLLNEIRLDFAQIRQLADDGAEFHATMSVGVVETNGDHREDLVLKTADNALYESKGNGRNQCSLGSLPLRK